jgi:hypothetical protein
MHDERSLFLKDLRKVINDETFKETRPDPMLIDVFGNYGLQFTYEFGGLVYDILKQFHYTDDAELWNQICGVFLSSHSDQIEREDS